MSKGEDLTSNDQESRKRIKNRIDFFSTYQQLESDNPILVENRMFWSRKGNSQKYICSLCNIGIEFNKNVNVFKTVILNHVKDKCHIKKFEANKIQESKNNNQHNIKTVASSHLKKDKKNENLKNDYSGTDETKEINNLPITKQTCSSKNVDVCNELIDFNAIYDTFEKSNPVTKASKQFLTKHDDGINYLCSLCDMLILNPLYTNEFRYNLWVHLNDECHRTKLPNFDEVVKDFEQTVKNISNYVPKNLQDDVKYFKIGPAFRFIECSLCQMAVSINIHRLEKHLRSEGHIENKILELKGSRKEEKLSIRTRDAFRKLIVKISGEFRKDIKFIRIGKMPGYVICSLCTYVVLPTQFYLQTHFETEVHKSNKCANVINKTSKFRIRLDDLMKTLPEDFRGYNIFKEDVCGLTCTLCQESIPATSYDLYSHINKERNILL